MILYHYTNKDSYESILKNKRLIPSNGFIQQDAAYGNGWYMTDKTPDECKGWTVAYCWQRVDHEIFGKVEYYLKFNVPDSLIEKGREHVYLIPVNSWTGDISSYGTIQYLGGDKVKKCALSVSCWICNKIQSIKSFFGWR